MVSTEIQFSSLTDDKLLELQQKIIIELSLTKLEDRIKELLRLNDEIVKYRKKLRERVISNGTV